jgi:hypothetical protein
MSISSNHQNLFHQSSAAEKISLVRSLMDTGDLNADIAMALLKSIHSELAQPQGEDHSLYASYAHVMASLQHQMPDVHQHVVTNWQAVRSVAPEEVSLEEEPTDTEAGGRKVEVKRTETSELEERVKGEEFWEAEGEPEEREFPEEEENIDDKDKEVGEGLEGEKSEMEESNEEKPENEEREQEDELKEENQEEEKEAEHEDED